MGMVTCISCKQSRSNPRCNLAAAVLSMPGSSVLAALGPWSRCAQPRAADSPESIACGSLRPQHGQSDGGAAGVTWGQPFFGGC